MRNTLPAASQKLNISSGKQRRMRRCLRMKKQSSKAISGCRSLTLSIPCSDERLDAVLGEYQKGEGLTYELAHALISAIYVHGHDSIEIVWKFKDIFADAEI